MDSFFFQYELILTVHRIGPSKRAFLSDKLLVPRADVLEFSVMVVDIFCILEAIFYIIYKKVESTL